MTDNYYINIESRIFLLQDDIDDVSVSKINFNLLNIIAADDAADEKEKDYKRKPIKIYINSNGGSVYDMWSLIDIIENSKTPIYTYCTGYAFSAGFKIFLAGHKRFITEHSVLMYHQLNSIGYCKKYQDAVEDMEIKNRLMEDIEKYVVRKTKWTKDFVENIRKEKKDFYIFSDKAIEYGLADEIISPDSNID